MIGPVSSGGGVSAPAFILMGSVVLAVGWLHHLRHTSPPGRRYPMLDLTAGAGLMIGVGVFQLFLTGSSAEKALGHCVPILMGSLVLFLGWLRYLQGDLPPRIKLIHMLDFSVLAFVMTGVGVWELFS